MAPDLGLHGTVVTGEDRDDCAQLLTRWLAPRALERIAQTGRLTIALSGGSSPLALFHSWRMPSVADELGVSAWEVYQVDDRAVPAASALSNAGMILRELIEPLRERSPKFFPLHGGAVDQHRAAKNYSNLLDLRLERNDDQLPVFDVIICGLGTDGHTASLFPGQPSLEVVDQHVICAEANVEPRIRQTLTFPVLNAARHLAMFAPGADKEEALSATESGLTPASRLAAVDQSWFVERVVTRRLSSSLQVDQTSLHLDKSHQ